MMAEMKSVTLRDRRMPGHTWFDNELIDVFGADLGPYGIAAYAVMARFCYGHSVTMSLRELQDRSGIKKDSLGRALKRLVELGLVIEREGPTPKSPSTYDLVDLKVLVGEIRAAARAQALSAKSVSHRDRSEEDNGTDAQGAPDGLPVANRQYTNGDAPEGAQSDEDAIEELEASDVSLEAEADCLPQRQGAQRPKNLKNLGNGAPTETDLSQNDPRFATDLSLTASRVNRQYTRLQDTRQVPAATAAWAASILAEIAPLGVVDAQASRQILESCRAANPDVTLEEILFWLGWLAEKAQQPRSGIRDPGAYVIRMVGDCVGGGQYTRLKAGVDRRRLEQEARESKRENGQVAAIAWDLYQPVAAALADAAWRAIRAALEKKVLPQSFETWIKPVRAVDFVDGELCLRVPSPEFQHIGDKYGDLIDEAIKQQGLGVTNLLILASPADLPVRGFFSKPGTEGEGP
jgi:DNA-binding HxlR family transcriptional regulator